MPVLMPHFITAGIATAKNEENAIPLQSTQPGDTQTSNDLSPQLRNWGNPSALLLRRYRHPIRSPINILAGPAATDNVHIRNRHTSLGLDESKRHSVTGENYLASRYGSCDQPQVLHASILDSPGQTLTTSDLESNSEQEDFDWAIHYGKSDWAKEWEKSRRTPRKIKPLKRRPPKETFPERPPPSFDVVSRHVCTTDC